MSISLSRRWRFGLTPWRGIGGFWQQGDPRWVTVTFYRDLQIGPLCLTWSRMGRP